MAEMVSEFEEQILAELKAKGLHDEELYKQLEVQRAKIRPAVKEMITAAEQAARGYGEFYSYEDVFGKGK